MYKTTNLSSTRIFSLITTLHIRLPIRIRILPPTPLPRPILPHTNNRQKPNDPTTTVSQPTLISP